MTGALKSDRRQAAKTKSHGRRRAGWEQAQCNEEPRGKAWERATGEEEAAGWRETKKTGGSRWSVVSCQGV